MTITYDLVRVMPFCPYASTVSEACVQATSDVSRVGLDIWSEVIGFDPRNSIHSALYAVARYPSDCTRVCLFVMIIELRQNH